MHIPQQTKAKQLQLEVNAMTFLPLENIQTQVDASYSLTDNIVLAGGGVFLKERPDDDGYTDEIDYVGGHFGLGFLTQLSEDLRSSSMAGVAIQSWSFQLDDYDANQTIDNCSPWDCDFTRFDATVVNPFAQTSVIYGSRRTNLSFSLRVEAPAFDFENAEGAYLYSTDTVSETRPLDTESQLYTVMGALHGNYGINKYIGLYAQLTVQRNFNVEDSTGIKMNEGAFYTGLSATFGDD